MKPIYRRIAAVGVVPAAFGYAAAAQDVATMPSNAASTQPVWNFHHEQLLGTSVQIRMQAADRATADRAEAAALAVMDREEAVLSAWKPTSEFARWSKTRFEAVPVSRSLFAALAGFDHWRSRTDGALDPSVEAATRLWKQASQEGRTPTEAEIAQVREAIQQPHWSLDAAHQTATRLDDTPLALASFVKNRILDQATEAALSAGASGVLLNAGGDVIARGAMMQVVEIADPKTAADNAAAMDTVIVQDRAVATSGGARRGFEIGQAVIAAPPAYSHLIHPQTARPVGHVLSSTVIARDAETAGALATAFAVMPVAQSKALAATLPQVEYMLVLADGSRISSAGWRNYSFGGQPWLAPSALTSKAPVAGLWNQHFELALQINLPQISDARYRRPFVAVWVEDADHYPVRTLALWANNARWLPDLKRWYHNDQVRNLSEGTDISRTVGSATRPAGQYNLLWDGKDNQGKPVKAGTYTICIEAAREHGGYQLQQHTINLANTTAHAQLGAGQELGTIVLDYRKRK